jgi:CheY-like chemotaxis protein
MTTLIIEDNSVQARQFLKFVRTLPFVTVKEEEAVAKSESEFNLYESLDCAFAEVKLMMDGKMPKKSLDEFIEELRKEREDELQYNTHETV